MQKVKIVRPVVLMSVVDHYQRVNSPKVMGVLLGESNKNTTIISNSFAVPFEKNSSCWFFDTSYVEQMLDLFYRANPMEKVIGWYQSSSVFNSDDAEITKAFKKYCNNPILVNIDVNASGFPVKSYQLVNNKLEKTPIKIEAGEAEEVGVEHLLKNYNDLNCEDEEVDVKAIKNSLVEYEKCLTKIIDSISFMEKNGIEIEKINAFNECLNLAEKCKTELKSDETVGYSDVLMRLSNSIAKKLE